MKIKQIAKYLLPIVLVVGIVVAFLLSRMSQPSGKDKVLTGDVELPQDQEGNYISQKYESNLIPSDTGYTVNEQPVDNVIRVDDGESGKESEYIYIEVADTDIKDLYKKEDLLDGHPTTDQITNITEDILNTENVCKVSDEYLSDLMLFKALPEDLAYDTSLVLRTLEDKSVYVGMLYGRWLYAITEEEQQKYNITAELIIASYYSSINLTTYVNEQTNKVDIVLYKGSIFEEIGMDEEGY